MPPELLCMLSRIRHLHEPLEGHDNVSVLGTLAVTYLLQAADPQHAGMLPSTFLPQTPALHYLPRTLYEEQTHPLQPSSQQRFGNGSSFSCPALPADSATCTQVDHHCAVLTSLLPCLTSCRCSTSFLAYRQDSSAAGLTPSTLSQVLVLCAPHTQHETDHVEHWPTGLSYLLASFAWRVT